MTKKIRTKAKAVADSHEWGYANTGTEQVGMRVVMIGGDFDGQQVTWYGYFTEATEQRTLESLRIAGWDETDIINLPGLGTTEFELQLEEETDDQGATYLRPTFINKIGVAMRNKMDDGQKQAFAARMRALTKSAVPAGGRPAGRHGARFNGGAQAPAQPFDESAPMPDNDIDF